jgi:WD40 repeat protein
VAQPQPVRGAPPERPAPRTDLYGDPLPEGAIARLGTTRFRHAGQVTSVAYSPDGRLLATGGYDDTIHLWQASSGKELFRFALPPSQSIRTALLAIAPDGAMLAGTNNSEHSIHLWDITTGKERRELKTADGRTPSALAFSGDGSLLAAICWSMKGWESDTRIRLWHVKTGKQVEGFESPTAKTWSIAFSPDGKSLAVAQEGEICTYSAATGRKLRTLFRDKGHYAVVAFSPNSVIASSAQTEKVVRLWDAASGRAGHVLSGHKEMPGSLAFSADGKRLVSASGAEGCFHVWDAATGKEVRSHQGLPGIGGGCVALSPDGKTVAEGSGNCISALRLWDVATDKEIVPATGHLSAVGFMSFLSGDKVVSSNMRIGWDDIDVRVWEARTGKQVARAHGSGGHHYYRMALSPNGRTAAVSRRDGTVGLWDLGTGKETSRFAGGAGSSPPLAFSPDGKTLAVSGRLWDISSGKLLGRFQPSRSLGLLAFSPDGKKVAGLGQQLARLRPPVLLDAETGKDLGAFEPVEGGPLIDFGASFSPDGALLAASCYPKGFAVWDVDTLGLLGRFGDEGQASRALTFSPDGRLLACCRDDGSVEVWETLTWTLLGKRQGPKGWSFAIAFSADGRMLASGHENSTALVWDVPSLWSAGKHEAALTKEQLVALWVQLGSDQAREGYHAITVLSQAPAEAWPLIRQRVRPGQAVKAAPVSRLIANLDSEDFAAREKATRELAARGASIRPALSAALADNPSPETRRRLEALLAKLRAVKPHQMRTAEEKQALRAIAVLAEIGTPDARQLLADLAGGAAESPITRAARQAQLRLTRRTAAP